MIEATHSQLRCLGVRGIAVSTVVLLLVAAAFCFRSAIAAPTHGPGLAPAAEELSVGEWEALWTSVLMQHVDEAGRIDFAALTRDHADLDRVVAFVAAVDPISQPQRFPDPDSRLAFYIGSSGNRVGDSGAF